MKIYFLALTMLCMTSPSALFAADTDTPGQAIVMVIDEGLRILRDPKLQSEEKMPERREKLWMVLAPVFDFEEVGKRAIGRYWRDLNLKQQEEFSKAFSHMLKRMYLNKSDLYREGNVEYIQEIVKGRRGKVQTNFVKPDGGKIEINLSMSQDSDGIWKIYDIQIGGVSILSNYRSQFNSILVKASFEDLMVKIYEKIDESDF